MAVCSPFCRSFLIGCLFAGNVFGQNPAKPIILALSGGDEPSGDRFQRLTRSGFLSAESGVVFAGELPDRSAQAGLSDLPALWRGQTEDFSLLARVDGVAPGTGKAVFASLPQLSGISATGEVTFLAALREGTGEPAVVKSEAAGLWSEIGGEGLQLLLRQGDELLGQPGLIVDGFATGAFATAHVAKGTGEAVFSVLLKSDHLDSALLRVSVSGGSVTKVQILARDGMSAPGMEANFGLLHGPYTDPARMDDEGNVAFAAVVGPKRNDSLWYQARGGEVQKVFAAGDPAPGAGGATFLRLQKPSLGTKGVLAFHATLNAKGDESLVLKNDGIWRGSVVAGFQPILRKGDANLPGMPEGSKVGQVWSGWLTSGNHGAWMGRLDVNGDGFVDGFSDPYAIFADTSGSMSLVISQGDEAPDLPGATMRELDHPVVGGQEQLAFLGVLTGSGITSANDKGVWRQAPKGGKLSLLLRSGDLLETMKGRKTVEKIDLPGSGQKERRWEQPVMDKMGGLLVFVTFTDGSTAQVLLP